MILGTWWTSYCGLQSWELLKAKSCRSNFKDENPNAFVDLVIGVSVNMIRFSNILLDIVTVMNQNNNIIDKTSYSAQWKLCLV